MSIETFLDENYLKYNIEKYTYWNIAKAPHAAIFGNTGSGKTYATKLLLGRISCHYPESQLFICDFKGDSDFAFLDGESNFYRFMDCENGFDNFYKCFKARQSGESIERNLILILFDEWSSYILNQEKKKAEDEKKKMATLLMLGRSFNVHVLISQQRIDATYFNSARDNLNVVIALGNLSKEGKEMAFLEFKELMKSDRRQGTGYMITNGTDFTPIVVPTITDVKRLNLCIKKAVHR